MKKLLVAITVVAALCAGMIAGCSGSKAEPDPTKEILVVSFGTSFADNREETIGAVESAIQEAFPEWTVARAFTAQIIIDKVAKEEGVEIDNFEQALQRAHDNGVTTLVIQPTHLMHGLEYTDVKNTLAQYEDQFETVVLAEPLLSSDEDFEAVAKAITDATKDSDNGTTALVFMGHGTEADSNAVYAKMQGVLTADGFANYYVGTVEATPSLDDVIAAIDGKGYTDVVLTPLMVVAGDHANNDMAAQDDPESWYSILTAKGYNVTANLTGLGSLKPIQDLYVQHTQAAIDSIQ
ncbi:MAG: sirohydrochlorin cobaltochelatase [bacterium]|nr:sirohydrochlorin cobaltochelatase [bacterium]